MRITKPLFPLLAAGICLSAMPAKGETLRGFQTHASGDENPYQQRRIILSRQHAVQQMEEQKKPLAPIIPSAIPVKHTTPLQVQVPSLPTAHALNIAPAAPLPVRVLDAQLGLNEKSTPPMAQNTPAIPAPPAAAQTASIEPQAPEKPRERTRVAWEKPAYTIAPVTVVSPSEPVVQQAENINPIPAAQPPVEQMQPPADPQIITTETTEIRPSFWASLLAPLHWFDSLEPEAPASMAQATSETPTAPELSAQASTPAEPLTSSANLTVPPLVSQSSVTQDSPVAETLLASSADLSVPPLAAESPVAELPVPELPAKSSEPGIHIMQAAPASAAENISVISPVEQTPPLPAPQETASVTPAPTPVNPPPENMVITSPEAQVETEHLSQQLASMPTQASMVPNVHEIAGLAPAAGGDAQIITAPDVAAAPVASAPLTPDNSEPAPTLSPESKAILSHIPAHIDTPAKAGKTTRTKISREHYAEDILAGPGAIDTARSHEALGIKIDVKKQRMDANYELEKAYNALISGQSEAAMQIYQNVLASEPDNTSALFGLATAYHRAGQLEKARPLYGRILQIDPDNRNALNNFLVLIAGEAPEEALTQLERLRERNPDFSPIPAQMAGIYQKMGDFDAATAAMTQAISLSPENLTYRYNLAVMLDKQGKRADAAEVYKQLTEAYAMGETIPNIRQIQERLTFLRSNQ